jgi:hypothetical protein
VFSITGESSFDDGRIALLAGRGSDYRTLVEQGYHARVLSSGHLVYVLNGNVMALPFDVVRATPTGTAVRVAGAIQAGAVSGGAAYAVSDSGLLIYQQELADSRQRTLVWVTREGQVTSVRSEPDAYLYPRLSPDGRSVAVGIDRDAEDVWLIGLDRPSRRLVTAGDRGVGGAPPHHQGGTPGPPHKKKRGHNPPHTQGGEGWV